MLDEANRGALGIDVAISIPATRVIVFLTQMIDLHGRPNATVYYRQGVGAYMIGTMTRIRDAQHSRKLIGKK